MEKVNDIAIPASLAELVDPKRTALLVYDMQAGIFSERQAGEYLRGRLGVSGWRPRLCLAATFYHPQFSFNLILKAQSIKATGGLARS